MLPLADLLVCDLDPIFCSRRKFKIPGVELSRSCPPYMRTLTARCLFLFLPSLRKVQGLGTQCWNVFGENWETRQSEVARPSPIGSSGSGASLNATQRFGRHRA